jgi:hypothetical protein
MPAKRSMHHVIIKERINPLEEMVSWVRPRLLLIIVVVHLIVFIVRLRIVVFSLRYPC